MPVTLTRTVGFHAWHRFHRQDWTPERNREVFGDLNASGGHDHRYRCSVTVSGSMDPEWGGVMSLLELDRVLEQEVVKPLEGRHIDRDVPHFAPGRALPTCEALASWLYDRIASRLPRGVRLDRVRVAEDDSLHADCTGPT